jgi:aryl-alcohol dehydrogenase-like predicted oxidoreductase
MNKRKLGENGPFLTEIGFGAWAIGGPWEFGWGPVDDEQSVKAVHLALDLGINWIDTAAVYGLGHSEDVVARALKGIRKNVFIATKCGMIWDDCRKVKIHASPESIQKEIDNSLKRLQTDYIDLYQIHWSDPETSVEDSWGLLTRLKEQGKVRYIGVCNYDVPLLEKCRAIAPVQSLQPPYNLLRRKIEKDILPYCLKHNIGVVAYSPMQAGLLTGKFDLNKVAADDWRRKNMYYQEPFLSKVLQFIESIRPIAMKYKKTVGQLTVAWVLNHPAVTSAIVGARTAEQVEGNVGASGFKLSTEDIQVIEEELQITMS